MTNHLTDAFGAPLATLVRGEGCYVWDAGGKQYLDFLGGVAVNALGHAHPAVVEAVCDQVATLGHISNFFISEPQVQLASRLSELADLGDDTRIFFTNSGAEANEAAFKMVRLHGAQTGKTRVVALEGAFHGRTMGALALTSKEAYRAPFQPLPGPVTHVAPEARALEEAMEDDVAAVFVEPILGEAGVRELPPGFLLAARELTEQNNALLVVDEVQTGIGRTGEWFAHHGHGADDKRVRPDIVTVAKGLGAGIPVGAAIAGPRAAGLFYPGSHGSTFAGNPLSSRVALAVLRTIEEDDLLQNARVMGERLRSRIEGMGEPLVVSTSGAGLLIGVHLAEPVAVRVAAEALALGLIVNAPNPSTVRLAPPLIVEPLQINQFMELFAAALLAARRAQFAPKEAEGDRDG